LKVANGGGQSIVEMPEIKKAFEGVKGATQAPAS